MDLTNILSAHRMAKKALMLWGSTGLGKCLGYDTPVLMFDGSIKRVQDINIGNLLMGPDGKPRTVLSTTKGHGLLYRIKPVRGEEWVCNDVHVLTLKKTGTEETIDIPINEYVNKSKHFKHLWKQFRVGVEFPAQEIDLDPYILGIWLGDGTSCCAVVTNREPEIRNYVKNVLPQSHEKEVTKNNTVSIRMTTPLGQPNDTWTHLKKCHDEKGKRIPFVYLVNSRQNRLHLLAGLLDTDGYIICNSGYEIATKYDGLKDDILFLCRSLGFCANATQKKSVIKSSGFEGFYWRITIWRNTSEIPCKVPRRQAAKRQQIKNPLNTGFTVSSKGNGDYYGFELDGDGRFLLGDFTVTHNTSSVKQYAKDNNMAIIIRNAVYLDPLNCWLPRESDDGNFIIDKPHKWVYQVLTTAVPTVLFLDEITRCRSLQIMNMLTELILERTFNGEPISPNVQLVMASNLYDEDNGLVEIPDAVLHRMTHIVFAPTPAESMNHMRTKLGREVILSHPKVLKAPGIPSLALSGNPRQIDEIVELWETTALSDDDLYVVARGRIGLEAGNLVAAAIIDLSRKKKRKLPTRLARDLFPQISEVEQSGMGIEVVNLLQMKGNDPRMVADYLIQYATPETCRAMQVAKFIYTYPSDCVPVDRDGKPLIDPRSNKPVRPGLPNIYYEVVLKKLSDGGS